MNIIIWLVVGGVIGWGQVFSCEREGILLNVVVGIVSVASADSC